jgi:hypothetical protein
MRCSSGALRCRTLLGPFAGPCVVQHSHGSETARKVRSVYLWRLFHFTGTMDPQLGNFAHYLLDMECALWFAYWAAPFKNNDYSRAAPQPDHSVWLKSRAKNVWWCR